MLSSFKLSDPGLTGSQDPALAEYLRAYGLPLPPATRYGFVRFASEQPRHRVMLFGQAWVPMHAVGTIFLLHGFAEHSANYARLIHDFVSQQFAVIALDHRGHGLSEGPPGHADGPDAYAEDAEAFLREVFPAVLPNRPLFVWAHSMGALVALQLLLRARLPVKPAAVVLSSPLLGFPELTGMQKLMARLAPFVARLLPTLPIAHGILPTVLSRDEEYLARLIEDPLVKQVATPRWLTSMHELVNSVQAQADAFPRLAPTLLLLAGKELVTNLSEARKFAFRAYSSMRHKVIEFPGILHELEKEPEARARVVAESLAWFRSHL